MPHSQGVRFAEDKSASSSPLQDDEPSSEDFQVARRQHGTVQASQERGQECLLRFPGMSEKTKKVTIAGKPAMIVEASLDGVRVRIPDGLVEFQNEDGLVEQEIPTDAPPDLSKGESLHEEVSSEKWCVTLQDLEELRCLVKHALDLKLIQPTSKDQFDPNDRVVGPNIHTVTEQFIKKVTAKKGGMSWALMKNEKGLDCDLFITHGWDEGIFEFLDKVIVSWPRGSQHAYCCMLANPQNLNIGALLDNPKDSPFAKALKNARKMMVVPNSKKSIYTRLWCAYEAYTAYEEKKFIFTARAPLFSRSLRSIAIVAAFGAAGVAHRTWAEEHSHINKVTWASPFALALLTLMARRSAPEKFVFCCVGARDSMYVATACVHQWIPPNWFIKADKWTVFVQFKPLAIMYALFTTYFVISAADHVSANVYNEGAAQLEAGYRGIAHATCSRKVDEEAIWKEMEHKKKDVDKAVRVLIDAGMSTKRLMAADGAGVKVNEVGYIQWAPTVIALIWTSPFLFTECESEISHLCTIAQVSVLCDLAASALLVAFLVSQELDQRAVAIACLQKMHLLLPVVIGPLCVIDIWLERFTLEAMFAVLALVGLLMKPICAYFMRMQLGEIAHRFGTGFAQFLVTYGYGLSDKADWGQVLDNAEVEMGQLRSAFSLSHTTGFGRSREARLAELVASIHTSSDSVTSEPPSSVPAP